MTNNISFDEINLLQEQINCGKLSLDVVNILAMKKDKIMSVHDFKITSPKDNKSRWSTYIKGDNNNRIKVTSTTEKGLYDKLYKHYFVDNMSTISSLYPEWLELRKEQGISPRTIARNMNHYDKYYRSNKLVDIPINRIDASQIESFLYSCIKEYDITVKELGNMKFILTDIFKYAYRKKLITRNPMQDVEVKTVGCKPTKNKSDSSRAYLTDEQKKMFDALNYELEINPDRTQVYAIFLIFTLGLRIGEVVALKWSDIDFTTGYIHINRTESRDFNSSGKLSPTILEHTKKKSSSGDRFLPLSEYEKGIFRTVHEINSRNGFGYDDFIFCNGKKRTTIAALDRLIRKCCKRAKIEEKSAHDIRRTVASEMFRNGVPVVTIRDFLGHSDISTTYGYILDNMGKSERAKLIFNSLQSMNGLERTQVYSS